MLINVIVQHLSLSQQLLEQIVSGWLQCHLFLGVSLVCKRSYSCIHTFTLAVVQIYIHLLCLNQAFQSSTVLYPGQLGLAANVCPLVKLGERGTTLHHIHEWSQLTCHVFSLTEAAVYGAKAAQHGSCPHPHHGDGVACCEQAKTVPTFSQVHQQFIERSKDKECTRVLVRGSMKLLTHNMLTSHVKGVKNGFPLKILVC